MRDFFKKKVIKQHKDEEEQPEEYLQIPPRPIRDKSLEQILLICYNIAFPADKQRSCRCQI